MRLGFPRITLSPLQCLFSKYVVWSINVPFVSRHLLSPRSVVFSRLRTRPQATCRPIPYGCAVSINNPSHLSYNSKKVTRDFRRICSTYVDAGFLGLGSCFLNRGSCQHVLGQVRNIPVHYWAHKQALRIRIILRIHSTGTRPG